ncbi:MAG: hypothetical protein U9Q80_05795 [Bacillota bacterium]|nr:hypothetical protein [Bacillota bacterium]
MEMSINYSLIKSIEDIRLLSHAYLNGKTSSTTRKRTKYLDEYRDLILKLITDKHRTFDYIDHLHNYLVREHKIVCSRSTLNRYVRMDDEINLLFNKKKTQKFMKDLKQILEFKHSLI